MSVGALKLSAKQALRLPLPSDEGAWVEGAALLRDAHKAGDDERLRIERLEAFGRRMCVAYGVEVDAAADLARWWLARLRATRRPRGVR